MSGQQQGNPIRYNFCVHSTSYIAGVLTTGTATPDGEPLEYWLEIAPGDGYFHGTAGFSFYVKEVGSPPLLMQILTGSSCVRPLCSLAGKSQENFKCRQSVRPLHQWVPSW